MPLIILPISNIKLFIIVEALSLFSISGILLPVTMILVARCLFSIGADVGAEAITLLQLVDIAFVGISIGILYPNDIPTCLFNTALRPRRYTYIALIWIHARAVVVANISRHLLNFLVGVHISSLRFWVTC